MQFNTNTICDLQILSTIKSLGLKPKRTMRAVIWTDEVSDLCHHNYLVYFCLAETPCQAKATSRVLD